MFRLFRPISVIRLGRWQLTTTQQLVDRKVDLANHDHCGPCDGKEIVKKTKKIDAFDNSMDISICALQSFSVYPSKKI
jgi:hypothetical protein